MFKSFHAKCGRAKNGRKKCHDPFEGDWQPRRLVIIEFANTEAFKRWYDSPEYSKARAIRFSASTSRAVLLRGV
ncbi:MAG: DUF1330 domain-containing protein [Ktedonobacteraceae bacterium]|nr:DUF1330 domain-containing protein [Ktedonobacteraceae bacterium]